MNSRTSSILNNTSLFQKRITLYPSRCKNPVRISSVSLLSICCDPSSSIISLISSAEKSATYPSSAPADGTSRPGGGGYAVFARAPSRHPSGFFSAFLLYQSVPCSLPSPRPSPRGRGRSSSLISVLSSPVEQWRTEAYSIFTSLLSENVC